MRFMMLSMLIESFLAPLMPDRTDF